MTMYYGENPFQKPTINVHAPRGIRAPRLRTLLKVWLFVTATALLAPLLALLSLGASIKFLNWWQPW